MDQYEEQQTPVKTSHTSGKSAREKKKLGASKPSQPIFTEVPINKKSHKIRKEVCNDHSNSSMGVARRRHLVKTKSSRYQVVIPHEPPSHEVAETSHTSHATCQSASKPIYVPWVREVPDYANREHVPYARPDEYIKTLCELKRALQCESVIYDADSEDEDWLRELNARIGVVNAISIETFEFIIDQLERAAFYQRGQVQESDATLMFSDMMTDMIIPTFNYWKRKKRRLRRKKVRLIKVLRASPIKKSGRKLTPPAKKSERKASPIKKSRRKLTSPAKKSERKVLEEGCNNLSISDIRVIRKRRSVIVRRRIGWIRNPIRGFRNRVAEETVEDDSEDDIFLNSDLYLRVSKLQKEGKKHILVNEGIPYALGQSQLSFPSQVVALCNVPVLLNYPEKVEAIFPTDAITRAKQCLSLTSGGLGAFCDLQGLPGIREEVAHFIGRRDGYPSDPELVFLTDGATEGVMLILSTIIVDEEVGVLVPVPQCPLYSAATTSLGGLPVPYYLDENWDIDFDNLQQSIVKASSNKIKVRALVITNPGNPTGQCLSETDLKKLLEFCFTEKLILLADEVNQQNILNENSFISAKKVLLDMGTPFSRFIPLVSFHSVSQGYWGDTGQRGGYFELTNVTPSTLNGIRQAAAVSSSNITGQILVSLMLNPPKPGDVSHHDFMQESMRIRESLSQRASIMADYFNSCRNCSCEKGAIYSFPRIDLPPKAVEAARKAGGIPDFYCRALLEETGISTIYCLSDRNEGSFHFSISLLPALEEVAVIMLLFKKFNYNFMEKYQD